MNTVHAGAFLFFCLPVVLCQLPTGLSLVDILGGTFTMGVTTPSGPLSDRGTSIAATPAHTVTLQNFRISVTEVTNTQYSQYLNAARARGEITVEGTLIKAVGGAFASRVLLNTGCLPGTGINPINRSYINFDPGTSTFVVTDTTKANWPVVCVSWYGAWAFATFYGVSLPTEAQFEYAAGAAFQREYATRQGNLTPAQANYNVGGDCRTPDCSPRDVASYPANDFGLSDMGGNVWEWTLDWYSPTWYSRSPLQDPQAKTSDGEFFEPIQCPSTQQTGGDNTAYSHPTRANRGGSFATSGEPLKVLYRSLQYGFSTSVSGGFRVATGGDMTAALPSCFMTQCSIFTLADCQARGQTVQCSSGAQCNDNDACTTDTCSNFQCVNSRLANCQVIFVPNTATPPSTSSTIPPTVNSGSQAPAMLAPTTPPITTSDDDDAIWTKWWLWGVALLALLLGCLSAICLCLMCKPKSIFVPVRTPPPPCVCPAPPPIVEATPTPPPPFVLSQHYYPPPTRGPTPPPPLPLPLANSPRGPQWEWSSFEQPPTDMLPPNPPPMSPYKQPPSPLLSPHQRIQQILARAAAITAAAETYPPPPPGVGPPPY